VELSRQLKEARDYLRTLAAGGTGADRNGNLTDVGRRDLYDQASLVDALQRRQLEVVRPGR
jgi:hypothetical protein